MKTIINTFLFLTAFAMLWICLSPETAINLNHLFLLWAILIVLILVRLKYIKE